VTTLDTISKLEPLLPDFLTSRRWFRSKARTIQNVLIEDVVPIDRADSSILMLRVGFADGASDLYVLPVSIASGPLDSEEVITSEGGRVVYGALSNPAFRDALLDAVRCERRFNGARGEFLAARTSAFDEECGANGASIDSFVSRAEQSNTSVIYRDRYILKLFRRIEAGVNPDVEVGRFLTERGFEHTPAVLGTLAYRTKNGAEYAAGILQEFVPNRGDAWKYTLESLSEFFERALARKERPAPTLHPLDLMRRAMPDETRELLGEYADSAGLLGRRTAEMHAALTGAAGLPDFVPEPFTPEDAAKLYEEMRGQADFTFELLRHKQAVLTDAAAEAAGKLLRIEDQVTARFTTLKESSIDAVRIRYHGDFHLGQVLYTGRDFMIIDFEGEPARPLADRRAKTLAMRDVAGMIRSFQYAGYAALFGQVSGLPAQGEVRNAVESWAAYWTAWVSAAFLRVYFDEAGSRPFVPADPQQQRILFDAFLLQKALYEVAYELNNRPDWVRIPLHGILSLTV
jgi:trehalose synthase-fused probable maltokinase